MIEAKKRERESEERAELAAVLASGIFARAPNLAKLLSYICERYWEGEIESIKEYRLAVEALGRPPDFDPSSNAIVRVEVHRLREKLRKYYENEGAFHKVVISFQPGRYIPQFIHQEEIRKVPVTTPLPHPPAKRNWIPVAAGGAILALIAALAVATLWHPRTRKERILTSAVSAPGTFTPVLPGVNSEVRIIAGYSRKDYIDRSGNVWLGDRYFDGGSTGANDGAVILRTGDPTLFQTYRIGDFSYNIPLKPGDYELWLYFVETLFGPGTNAGGGAASRMFRVLVNGQVVLNNFDIFSDAGGNFIADVRVFKDIRPAPDGYLHVAFQHENDAPLLNAIQIVPGIPGKLRPIRIVCRDTSYTDHSGDLWVPDRYCLAGRLVKRKTPVMGTLDPGLYSGERFGNFSYAIPSAPGKYAVTLYFCEQYFGAQPSVPGGDGLRVFNVFCNGRILLKNFDIYKEARGAERPISMTFHNIEPNAQGKIMLQFEPEVNYALVNAISVTAETRSSSIP
jgi:hypothetical protein